MNDRTEPQLVRYKSFANINHIDNTLDYTTLISCVIREIMISFVYFVLYLAFSLILEGRF